MWHRVTRLAQAARVAYDFDGLGGAVRVVAVWVQDLLFRPLDQRRDRQRDQTVGIDTQTTRDAADAARRTSDAGSERVGYARASTRRVSALMRWLPVRLADMTFIDLGCGKGSVLLSAMEFGFNSVIGVEIDQSLAATARRNIDSFSAATGSSAVATVIESDVARYEFPATDPCVVFLYNPFGPRTLQAALHNVVTSHAASPREIWVAYLNPLHQRCFADFDQFTRVAGAPANYAVFRLQ